jgi:3-hydroxyacyl-[acyl-carrier-protein] dehydratase
LGINNVKFRRKIIPGETLTIHATLQSLRRGIATGSAVSYVGEAQACSADFVVAVPDILGQFKPKDAA